MLKLERPLICFDLETTGLDHKYDRIIEIGAVKVFPDGKKEVFHKRVNPGMRIPAEVSALTGITNEMVANEPAFIDLIDEVERFFEGSDLAGYNIARFDAKVMVEEFRRTGRDFALETRAVIDSQVIFHQKERRDLSAAYKYYCNKELKQHHSATADTQASLEILYSQLERYPDLPHGVKDLHQFCSIDRDRFVDAEGKFFWRDGEAVFNFGKFRSLTLRDVARKHPEYLDWVLSPDRQFSQEVIDLCYNAKQGRFPVKKVEDPRGTSG